MTKTNLLLGQTLHFSGNPMTTSWEDTVRIDSAGGVLVAAGKIIAVGPASALRSAHPEATVHDYGDALLCPVSSTPRALS
ncbi:MAG: hypothetical protein E8G75_00575, partial [Sulfitobacter sp. SK025]